jgi:3-oxoadipate enol-lactonase
VPFIDASDVRIHYRFDGPADAPVVMLGNSLGTTLAMWDAQAAALAPKRRVLRYDTRGHGQSSVTPGSCTMTQLARDALDLLDALGLDRVDYCGLSMGGMVGQWLGAHAPQRLRKLVLANTSARIGPPELWNARIDTVRREGMAGIVEPLLARWLTPEFGARSPAAVDKLRDMLLGIDPDGYVASCAAVRDMDQRAAAPRIAVPTLVIAGTHDAATPPADGRFLAESIGGARYVELPAAHLSNVEAEGAFTRALVGFLDT